MARTSGESLPKLRTSLSEAKEISVSEESVKASIRLSSLSHEAGEGDDVFLSSDLAFLIDLKNKRDTLSKKARMRELAILRVNLPLRFRSGQKRGPLM